MNASLRWLRDFLEGTVTAQEVHEILTARAATVEGVTPVRADLGEIIVGRVVEAERHPDSEHLWLTKVDSGSGDLQQVVCGAPVVTVGTAYPFAPVGTTLPGGLRIEKRKIRGQVSAGMLCSARELGLGSDHTGILALETDAAPGTPFLRAVDVGDVRFEIDVLPNRPDLLSHEGLAREIAAARGSQLREWRGPADGSDDGISDGATVGISDGEGMPEARRAKRAASTDGIRVAIEDVDGCWRYLATVIRGVSVGPSPRWLVERLEGAGVRSINNVVDVTNFMLHGFGQPMHAFDLSKLAGEVIIRRANQGERITTLDGVARTLDPATIVIAGGQGAEAIAGVIGGEGSEVSETTSDILLEVAVFNPKRVRTARRALGISTDASYRFERHVDLERLPTRAALAAGLITRVAGGRITAAPVDLNPVAYEPRTVTLRPGRAARVLGEAIAPEGIAALLQTVGFSLKRSKRVVLTVTAPSWRSDVVEEIDLIEEVARLHGYDAFPSDLRPFRPSAVPDHPMVAVIRRVRDALVARGLLEVRPMPFAPAASDERLRVRNPLAENEAYLRESLLGTLARRAEHNLAQMQRSVRLFEIGTVFQAGDGPRPVERTHVGLVVMGHNEPPHFTDAEPRAFDMWDIKWLGEGIAGEAFGTSDVKLVVSSAQGADGGSWRRLWSIEVRGRTVGEVVLLNLDAPVWASPAYALELDITDAVVPPTAPVGTVEVTPGTGHLALVGLAPEVTVTYSPLPATPPIEVDVALLVPDHVPAGTVEEAIRRHGGEILERVVLFDEFRGPGLDPGTRSLAWRLTFRHPDRTLRDREVESRKEKLIGALRTELGVRPRS